MLVKAGLLTLLRSVSVAAAAGVVLSPNNEWVNIDYVLQRAKSGSSSNTSAAQQKIVGYADSTAKSGPWSITAKNSVAPPSGDVHDYLSWAPYHWPECNWCSKGTNHLMNPGPPGNDTDGNNGDDDGPDDPESSDDGSPDDSAPNDGSSGDSGVPETGGNSASPSRRSDAAQELISSSGTRSAFGGEAGDSFWTRHRMRRVRRSPINPAPSSSVLTDDASTAAVSDGTAPPPSAEEAGLPSLSVPSLPSTPSLTQPAPTAGVTAPAVSSSSQPTTFGTVNGTPGGAQAAGKTKSSSCTPSPTKSLAPSATWTTCPYVVHDGKVNPDVATLPDSPSVVAMTESVFYNSVSYALEKSRAYSQNAANFVQTFFLTSSTAMNPNLNFGQLVRGPGKDHQVGTFTGVLDLRGMIKVVNGIEMLKAAGSPDWTPAMDSAMVKWMKQYLSWLQTSSIGKQVAAAPNNHFTFYTNQLTAANIYLNDTTDAKTALQSYFTKQFLDQVAASGEQPFEAVRTRPYHYRCFNLEAMIANAKMGDQLGVDFWTAKSRYGATIQTALDYTMALNPKSESVSDIFPHVAAVAAAYGDPQGKYAAFLQKQVPTYESLPFWFYDQSAALPNSPAGSHVKRDDISSGGAANVVPANTTIPFQCPAVFDNSPEVEIDDGIYVTCDELKPFYELAAPLTSGTP